MIQPAAEVQIRMVPVVGEVVAGAPASPLSLTAEGGMSEFGEEGMGFFRVSFSPDAGRLWLSDCPIEEGDLIVVESVAPPCNGDIVVARPRDGGISLYRFRRDGNLIELVPLDGSRGFTLREGGVDVLGVVVGVMKRCGGRSFT
jgi:SOS-response transcriptional repressor LexA